MRGLAIHQYHIKTQAPADILLFAWLLVYPFVTKGLPTIHIYIAGGWYAIVVNFNVAFHGVLPPAYHPPEIFGVIHGGDGKTIGTRRGLGWRGRPS